MTDDAKRQDRDPLADPCTDVGGLTPCPSPSPQDSNPFATRFTRPGAIPYWFEAEESVARLIARLRENNGWGQIVGPHGSGKSTLLATLGPVLRAAGQDVVTFVCAEGQRRLPDLRQVARDWTARTLVIVDGYEQLSHWSRWRLKRTCRVRGAGLLVTSHQPVGFPPLVATAADRETTRRLVDHLIRNSGFTIGPEQIDRLFQQHRGNVREILFGLYDLVERQRRANL
jgi:hypothetical protein